MSGFKSSLKVMETLFSNHSYVILLIPLFFVAYPLLQVPGIPIGNGDLPYLEASLYSFKEVWTWIEDGSYHNMESLPRYPFIGLSIIFQSLILSPELVSKLLIISGFAIASFSFYFSCLLFFRSKLDTQNSKFKIGMLLGSIFYAYNVWSFHRIGHWYFWIGYGLLPIFFVSVIYTLRNPKKLQYALACVVLWSIASSTPHMVIFYGLIFVGLSLIFLIKNFGKSSVIRNLLVPIFIIVAVYPLINLYWIYPYIASSTTETFLWSTVVTDEITKELSRESNFLNVFRLIEGTFNMGAIEVIPPENSLLYPFWIFAGFVPPILALTALIFTGNLKIRSIILFFSLSVTIGILFTVGSNAPFDLYSILLFSTPLISNLQVLFREPDKWGFLVGFGYSFLITISSILILKKFQNIWHNKVISIGFVVFILTSIVIYFYPAYSDSLNNLYHPIVLPDDFRKLDNSLFSFTSGGKVFYMPYSPESTVWAGDKGTLYIYPLSSPSPNIAPSDYNTVERYHDFVVNSIIKNRTNSINNNLYPLGTSFLLYHNDTLMPNNKELLAKIPLLDGISHVGDIGFFRVFKVGNGQLDELNIPKNNVLMLGGLDQLTALNYLPNFDSFNSSLLFLDQRIKDEKDKSVINNADYLLASKDTNAFILSLIDEKYVISPYDITNHHKPSELWSKAGVHNPGNAPFSPYLEKIGIENWDFDYGKGLVLTEAPDTNMTIPVTVDKGEQDVFIRYLKNPKGGLIKIYLDNKLLDEINTNDIGSANFVWEKVGPSLNLTKGKHTLTLQNAFGFNAVNIFAVMPVDEFSKLAEKGYSIVNETGNIVNILEAETSFVNSKGKDNVTVHTLFNNYVGNGTFNKTFSSQFKVPSNTDLLSLQILAKQQPAYNSSYTITKMQITFDEKENVFVHDFENRSEPTTVSGKEWINNNPKMLSTSTVPNKVTNSNNGLKVDVRQGNASAWSIISTGFIPVNENKYYNYSLDFSAKDVNQLHSKVIYYDANKNEIGWDFIFDGRDGTFEDNITNILQVPNNSSSIKLQILSHPNSIYNSSYILYDTRILPTAIKQAWRNDNTDSQTISIDQNKFASVDNALKVDVRQGNASAWSIISTGFIPVNENKYYNYSLDFSAKDVNQLHSKVIYYDANKNEIGWDFIFDGRDGTFEDNISHGILPVTGTEYIELQMLAHPNSHQGKTSIYWIDNAKLESIMPKGSGFLFKDDFSNFENMNKEDQKLIIKERSGLSYLKNELKKGDSLSYKVIALKPFHVKPDEIYNYTISMNTNDTNSLTIVGSFSNSEDVKKSDKYGTYSSNGMVLTMSPRSEISTDLNILRPSNYTIALKANTCKGCTFPTVNLVSKENNNGEASNNVTLIRDRNPNSNDNLHKLEWLYSNDVYLKKGQYDLKISSNSQTDLDFVVVYSSKENNNQNFTDKEYNKISDLFNLKDISAPAYISQYKKINPTKYVLDVYATKPFIISFAESYDPLWIAYAFDRNNNNYEGFKTNSIPLYSMINGFYINKTGNYTLNVEYSPQKWFLDGQIVSIVTLLLFIGFIIMVRYKKIIFKFMS